jgi:hypothetical protein
MAFALPRVVAASLAIVVIPHLSTRAIVAAVGLAYLLWSPVPPVWTARPRWVKLRFYEGGAAEETPRTITIGGEEQAVEMVGSWREVLTERATPVARRRLRLRVADGSGVEVVQLDGDTRWRVEKDLPTLPARDGGQ